MTQFWIVVAALVLLALAFVLPPLLRRERAAGPGREELNLAIHRERLAELKQLLAEGELSQAEFDQAVTELEQDLADDLAASRAEAGRQRGKGRWAAAVVAVVLPAVALGLYFKLGASSLLPRLAEAPTAPAGTQAAGDGLPSVDQMVASLEEKLRENPNNGEGWFLLGRSYLALDRFPGAVEAFRKARQLLGDQPNLLTQYAQALAMAQGGKLAGEPTALIDKALAQEPDNGQALFLAGVAAFQSGAFQQALDHWQRFVDAHPENQQDVQMVQGYMDRARQHLGTPPAATPPTSTAVAEANAPAAGGATASAATMAAGASLTVEVELAPELAAKAAPDDTVFVFARAVSGPRMPLAIVRKRVSDLPLSVTLDDSLAMMPAMKLSAFPEVVVGARVSKTGNAISQSGDLEGTVSPVAVASTHAPVKVLIGQVVP